MERFYIITNLMKDPDYGITKEIQKYIEQHGRECILAKEDEQGFIFPGTVPENVDCGIVLQPPHKACFWRVARGQRKKYLIIRQMKFTRLHNKSCRTVTGDRQ